MKYLSILITITILITQCACKKAVETEVPPPEEEIPVVDTVPHGRLTNLGPQVTESAISSGIFVLSDRGIKIAYTVVTGTPSRLVGYDVSNGKLIVNIPIRNVDSSWSLAVSTDGWLYIAGAASGRVCKHWPGSQLIEDLGKALPSESYVWEVTAGKDGEIFGATYPGCRVFRYHPNEGFSDVGGGAIMPGELYVRTIVYSEKNDKLYAGVGSSHANLIELDPRTGVKKEILPEAYKSNAGFVYPLIMVPDVTGGDRLFATVAGKTLVYNLNNSSKVEREITGTSSRAIIKSKEDDSKVYHSHSSTDLRMFDFSNPSQGSVKVGNTAKALGMMWISNNELAILNEANKLVKFNTLTKQSSSIDLDVPGQPIDIRMTALGPDGRIWTSGFPVGGNGAYDPVTGKTENYPGLTQAESITVDGDDLYFGNYPSAHIYVYNTKAAWDMGNGNPKRIAIISGEDRIFGGVSVPTHGSLFFGTVPTYGKLGGVLAQYDKNDKKLTNYGVIMPDLSIISLIHKDDVIFGGTSVLGGIGIDPSLSEAKLFAWDILGKKKLYDLVPVAGKRQITNLIIGPDGYIWGVADDTLFIFDPKEKKVLSTHKLVSQYFSSSWKNIELIINPNGKIYGAGSRQLFSIDPETKKVTKLLDDATWLSMDKKGRLYFRRGVDLWEYIP